jgi:Tol biopolymer transport system component
MTTATEQLRILTCAELLAPLGPRATAQRASFAGDRGGQPAAIPHLIAVPAAPAGAMCGWPGCWGSCPGPYPGMNGRLASRGGRRGRNVDVYSVKANGNDLRRLTDAPSVDACVAYAPDGKFIAFCSVFTGPGQGSC